MSTWPEKLISLIEVLEEQLSRLGISEPGREAKIIAVELLERVIGGDGCYMPKSDKIKAYLRDEEIWKAFNGNNKEHLARIHQVSTRHIEILVSRKLKSERATRQSNLL